MLERENINLDDPQNYQSLDPEGMLNHIHNFPRMCQQAWEISSNFKLPASYSRIKKIVILGMGGSAIAGDLVSSLLVNEASVPVMVCREYNLPRYVDAETLVIASSYSGMTEETLSAFEQAFDTSALKLAITTGGKLKSLCETMKVPVFTFNYQSQPRAALPFSFFIILNILHSLGIFTVKPVDISETFANLQDLAGRINEKVLSEVNPAKALAQKLHGRVPIIYGAGITAEVAHRWKTQLNENSKTMAFYEVFSELNHNSIVGYSFPEDLTHQAIVVMLDSDLLHERIRLRYTITQQLLDQAGIYYQVLKEEGSSALSQMLTLTLWGDYISYYLALLNQANPTVIPAISFLKDKLANQ